MTYIELINGFENWLETHHLPIASQLLWYKLIALFNRCGWQEWIAVDNQRLMSVMQIKREATFIEIRKNYFPCSNCNVLVAWSQTSVGPKYWIGPGYT